MATRRSKAQLGVHSYGSIGVSTAEPPAVPEEADSAVEESAAPQTSFSRCSTAWCLGRLSCYAYTDSMHLPEAPPETSGR